MAGYFIHQSQLSRVRAHLDAVRSRFFSHDKIHITDLSTGEQQQLRDDIFDYFKTRNVIWTYEAVYVEGFHQEANRFSQLSQKLKRVRQSQIKLPGNERREILHVELFQGTFIKAVTFCLDKLGGVFILNVITDQIDQAIMKQFNDIAKKVLNIGKKHTQNLPGGFDPATHKVVSGNLLTSEIVSGRDILPDFSRVSYSVTCEDSCLTLAADVLANSVHYYLKSLQSTNMGVRLNEKEAITGHPLEQLVRCIGDAQDIESYADVLFKHPNARTDDNQ